MGLKKKPHHGTEHWYYDFRYQKDRFRGYIAPVSGMTEAEALREFERVKAEVILNGVEKQKEERQGYTFKAVVESYLDYLLTYKGKKTHYNYVCRLKAAMKHFSAHTRKITQLEINAYIKKRQEAGIAGSTINREIKSLSAAYEQAVKQELVKSNPFKNVKTFHNPSRTRYLTKEELLRLLEECREHDETLIKCTKMRYIFDAVTLAVTTGMRLREITGLNVKEFDWDNGFIKKGWDVTKNKHDKVIPIPRTQAIVNMLYSRCEIASQPGRNGWLFWNPKTGKPIDRVDKAFKHCLRQAGITDFRFHDLRHTFGTYMLLAVKGDLRTTQTLLGHKSTRMTERYTHVLDETKVDAMSKLGALYGDMNLDKKADKGQMSNDVSCSQHDGSSAGEHCVDVARVVSSILSAPI